MIAKARARNATNWGRLRRILASALGVAAALLLARLVIRLLAARPDNSAFQALLALTTPPQLLAALDRQQPRFGATLELSTLALLLLVLLVGALVARIGGRRRSFTWPRKGSNHE